MRNWLAWQQQDQMREEGERESQVSAPARFLHDLQKLSGPLGDHLIVAFPQRFGVDQIGADPERHSACADKIRRRT